MLPNCQFPADLDKLTEEILNGKLHFLCSVVNLLLGNLSLTRSSISFVGILVESLYLIRTTRKRSFSNLVFICLPVKKNL